MSQLQNSSVATEAVSVSFQNSLVNGSAVNHLHRLRAYRWDRLCDIYYSAPCSGFGYFIPLVHLFRHSFTKVIPGPGQVEGNSSAEGTS